MEINVREARQRFSELLDRVEQGEEVVVTRHGSAIAKLVSVEPQRKRLPPLDTFRKTISATGTPSATLIRDDRNAR